MASLRAARLEYLRLRDDQPETLEEQNSVISDVIAETLEDQNSVEEITLPNEVSDDVTVQPTPDVYCPLAQNTVEEYNYPVKYLYHPEKAEVDDCDITVELMTKEDDFAIRIGVIPMSKEGTIHPSFKIALREGAEEGAPLIPGSFVIILYVFDRENVVKKIERNASPEELKSLGVDVSTLKDEISSGGAFDFQHIQNLQGDEQLRAIMQASQRETEEYELALAISLSTPQPLSPVIEEASNEPCSSTVAEEGSSSEVGSEEGGSSEGESDEFDYGGKWFVFDMRYMSIFLDMPFEERPFFISGNHKFSLIPEQWNTIKKRMEMINANPENFARYDEQYYNKYSALVNSLE
jgi:hypothetical protein